MIKPICEFLDRMEAEEKERYLLIDRWNCYQEIGNSISHEAVMKWPKSQRDDYETLINAVLRSYYEA